MQSTLSEELYSRETVEREYFQTKSGRRSDKYRKNLAKLAVYYQEFNYEHIKEIEAYPVSISPKTSWSDLIGKSFTSLYPMNCLVRWPTNGWTPVAEKEPHRLTLGKRTVPEVLQLVLISKNTEISIPSILLKNTLEIV